MMDTVTFTSAMEHAVQVFEVVGVAVLLVGLVWATAVSGYAYRRGHTGRDTYRTFREVFGGAILLALEVLVAADLIRSVAIDTTLESVAVLGLIVLIRTFLSFSLEIEIEGMVPWRRAFVSGATVVAQSSRAATKAGNPSAVGRERGSA
jgi:uncharacterized membrane protein